MKPFVRWSLMASGCGIFFFMAAAAFATVLDNVYVGGYGQAVVTPLAVNGSSIGPAPAAPQAAGTYWGGPMLAVDQPIDFYDSAAISPSGPSVGANYSLSVPVSYSSEPTVSVTLDSVGLSGSTPCSAQTVGACSPQLSNSPVTFSPIILMAASTGAIVAPGPGTATDTPALDQVSSNFSSAPSETQLDREALSSAETYAQNLAFGPLSAVPEPRFLCPVLLAGLLMGWVIAKRRKSEA
jgi:hypothetical protein